MSMTWNWNTSLLLFQLEITGTAIWINPFIGVLTITSLWPVAIIFINTNIFLRSLNIVPKYAIYQVSQHNQYHKYATVLSQLQERYLDILYLSCISSPGMGKTSLYTI